MSSIAQRTLSPEALARKWNERFPIRQRVRYWTGPREGLGQESRTTSPAAVLSGHSAVVWLEGVSGCIALSHVEPLLGKAASEGGL